MWLRDGPSAGRGGRRGVYRWAHSISRLGRGYGASNWVASGEAALLRRIARERPSPEVIFDVGAHVGGWALEAARVWPEAQIHAFEPARTTYVLLQSTTRRLRVRTVNAALSDAPGEADLHAVEGHPGLTSLHDRDLQVHGLEMTATETVPLMRLDDYASARGIDHIDFLRIDVEGHELTVLKGASRLSESGDIDLIQFEFGGTNIDSRTFLRDLVRYLEPR